MVTDVSKELTKMILTDFFRTMIELRQKLQKEVRVVFRGVGILHVFKNRDLAWSVIGDTQS
jgi:hypothetical protein